MNEFELIAKAKNGDQQAFGELALLYRKNITGLAYRMLGDLHEAEDITQNVFIRAYLSLANFSPNHEGSFKAWLLTIASRLCIDHGRRRSRQSFYGELQPYQEFESLEIPDNISEAIIAAEDRRLIQEALLGLPPNYRMAVSLKYMEELDYQEIAKVMKVPLGTVGTWIRRGLEKMRADLSAKGVNDDEKIAIR